MEVKLIADHREKPDLIEKLKYEFSLGLRFNSTNNIPLVLEIKSLPVGDYIIEVTNTVNCQTAILAVIERKTLKDYASSIKDGRHHNKEKLKQLSIESGCKIYYLVEGKLNSKYDTEYAGLKYCQILASIDRLMILDNFTIIQTADIEHTASRLKFLCESYKRACDKGEIAIDSKIEAGTVNSTGDMLSKCKLTEDQVRAKTIVSVWQVLPGVGPTTAPRIASKVKFIDWMKGTITEEQVAGLSKSIATLLTSPYDSKNDVAVLSKIPGITIKSAEKMLEFHTLLSILTEKIVVYKPNGNKVGPKTLTKIENILSTIITL